MNLTQNKTYKMSFPNGSTCIAKYVRPLEFSSMPDDYIFEGISGEFPKHDKMYPEFAFPQSLTHMIDFEEVDPDENTPVRRDIQVVIDEYLALPLTSDHATTLEAEMWEMRSQENKEQLRTALTTRLEQLKAAV